MLESLFNEVASLRPTTLLKRDFNTGVCEICEMFKNFFFYRATPVAASKNKIFEPIIFLYTGVWK